MKIEKIEDKIQKVVLKVLTNLGYENSPREEEGCIISKRFLSATPDRLLQEHCHILTELSKSRIKKKEQILLFSFSYFDGDNFHHKADAGINLLVFSPEMVEKLLTINIELAFNGM